jgi:hypothetical protein
MKWPYPMPGDMREFVRFALIPHCCDDGYTRWLEYVRVRQTRESGWWDSDWWRTDSVVAARTEVGRDG